MTCSCKNSRRCYYGARPEDNRIRCADLIDAVGDLQLADELDDLLHRPITHLRLRRHVAEVPVMLRNATLGSKHERGVGVVAGLIDLMDERRALVSAAGKGTMTGRAAFLKGLLAGLSRSRKLRKEDIDRAAGMIRSEPPKTGNRQQCRSQGPKSRRSLRSLRCHGGVSFQLNKNRFHQPEGQGT